MPCEYELYQRRMQQEFCPTSEALCDFFKKKVPVEHRNLQVAANLGLTMVSVL